MPIRTVLRIFHVIAGIAAFVTITRFLGTTIWTELVGSTEDVAAVKLWIVGRLPFLILSFIMVGATGFILSGRNPKGLAAKKFRRMKIIAPNGLLVLVPAALFLSWKAQHAQFDAAFYTVQAIEIVVGAINFTLLGLSMRDGLTMKGRLRQLKAVLSR
ncbi:hypothetical protein [Rhodopseudomonas sp.]|uniref:hypothetical protein n=1 Tax=Rhodopseudomonas sp. TaxID=1078 RepID=UPI0039E21787